MTTLPTTCVVCGTLTHRGSRCTQHAPATFASLHGSTGYGSAWRRARAAALDRDGHACVMCGSTRDLEVDHIVRKRAGGTDDLRNLRTLCHEHHHLRTSTDGGRATAEKASRARVGGGVGRDGSSYTHNGSARQSHHVRGSGGS
jgi:5-methylcytosine-specific restriction endonuclease McrA